MCCRQLTDNVWRGLRELHVWTAAWTSSVMSARLDAFFSLSLCHALITAVLFAAALSFYPPLESTYYQLAAISAIVYWLVTQHICL